VLAAIIIERIVSEKVVEQKVKKEKKKVSSQIKTKTFLEAFWPLFKYRPTASRNLTKRHFSDWISFRCRQIILPE
jgi:hypothetical protein